MYQALPTPFDTGPAEQRRLVEPSRTFASGLDQDAFAQALEDDIGAIGSISIGEANRGYVFNAVQMPESPLWILAEPKFSFGTRETVESLGHAITAVNRLYPDSPAIYIGHIGKERGGWLSPHRSHQSGRDVDLGFYYLGESRWYLKATPENFDVRRNWALLSALFKTTPVEYVFIDRSMHAALRAEAEAASESLMLIRDVFDGIHGKSQPLLRHARGHDDHMHVRFESAVAVANGLRVRNAFGRKAANRASLLAMLSTRAAKQKKH
jgi:murein endopeptidase